MDKPKIKAWYGVEDLLHLQVKIGNIKYAVAGAQSQVTQMTITLMDAVLSDRFNFKSDDILDAAYHTTIAEDNTKDGFELETGSD